MRASSASTKRTTALRVAGLLIAVVVMAFTMSGPANAATWPSAYPIVGTHNIPGDETACDKPSSAGLPTTANCGVWQVKQFVMDTYGPHGLKLNRDANQGVGASPYYRAVPAWAGGALINGALNGCLWYNGNMTYCALNNTVYPGVDGMGGNNAKRLNVAALLAHETGHAAAAQPFSGGENTLAIGGWPTKTAPEDQPDCFAGVFVKYAVDKGWYPQSAIADGEALFYSIGGTQLGATAHNINTERARFFRMGTDQGIGACNAIFPERPIAPWTA